MSNDRKIVNITIDGRQVEAEYRATLLEVAGRLGISIPTLCHHDALEPAGACRLCVVEQVRDGWSKFVTACNYPVDEGMVFRTSSPEVLRYRKMTLEALLARCPEVPAIVDLAARHEVTETRFRPGDDTCILCGMCTRVCETYATSAISMLNRGPEKLVGTFGDQPPQDCVGCGSCATVCPTDHITAERGAGTYTIWDREFKVALCGVNQDKCISCGACEEACPFAVPRVVLTRDGIGHAEIDPGACRGCGVCYASCPTGAIEQPRTNREVPQRGEGLLVIACGRANLASARLPRGVEVREMQCAGGVDVTMLLGALARGFDRVAVMGRHQSTCKLDGSEAHGRDVVRRVDELATLCGLGAGRAVFVEPDPGPEGPVKAVRQLLDTTEPTRLRDVLPTDIATTTPSDAFEIMRWLTQRDELTIDASGWLNLHDLPAAGGGAPSVDASSIPYMDILMAGWLRPADLGESLRRSLPVTQRADQEAGVSVSAFEADGTIVPTRGEIESIQAEMKTAAGEGRDTIQVDRPELLVKYLIASRLGSWRRTHVRPVLAIGKQDEQVSR